MPASPTLEPSVFIWITIFCFIVMVATFAAYLHWRSMVSRYPLSSASVATPHNATASGRSGLPS